MKPWGLRESPPWLPWPGRATAQLGRLAELPLNFDPSALPEVARDAWHVDGYRRALPGEASGDPVPGGPFETAVRLLGDYEFAEPRRVRAFYRGGDQLLGRLMLLELRYLFVRLRVGVRIDELWDDVMDVEGRPVRRWGWAYRTLQGHIERGQMDYQVWKWLDSGKVEFRINAVSQVAEVRNPVLRLGFRAVGRREQVDFARRCTERMERLVGMVLDEGRTAEPDPARRGPLRVSPTQSDPEARRRSRSD